MIPNIDANGRAIMKRNFTKPVKPKSFTNATIMDSPMMMTMIATTAWRTLLIMKLPQFECVTTR